MAKVDAGLNPTNGLFAGCERILRPEIIESPISRSLMQHISDLKIIGVDESRFPRLRKEPYIDLFFKLSHQAPADWCQDFNLLTANHEYTAKIDAKTGLFIETWVRKMDEIAGHLDFLKKKITDCNTAYIQKAKDREAVEASANAVLRGSPGEQEILNRLIASLSFD